MTELTLHDEKGNLITGDIDVGIVEAGRTKELPIILKNSISYPINAYVSVSGDDDVRTKAAEVEVPAKDSKKILISISPSLFRMKPIRFSINVKYDYLIK